MVTSRATRYSEIHNHFTAINNNTRKCELDYYRNITHKLEAFAIAMTCPGEARGPASAGATSADKSEPYWVAKGETTEIFRQCVHWVNNASLL
jgi:hypothetical protein